MTDRKRKKKCFDLQTINSFAVLFTAFAIFIEVILFFQSVKSTNDFKDRPALMIIGEPEVEITECEETNYLLLRYSINVKNQGSGNAYKIVYAEQNQIPPLHSLAKTKKEILSSYNLASEIFFPQGKYNTNNTIGAQSVDEFVFYETFSRYFIINKNLPGDINHKKYFAFFYESESGNKNATIFAVTIRINLNRCTCTLKIEDRVIVNDPRG